MTSRFRFCLVPAIGTFALLLLTQSGCDVAKMSYVESPELLTKLGDKPEMKDEEKAKAAELRKGVEDKLADLFGADPLHIKVPKGSGLPGGGIHLASLVETQPGQIKRVKTVKPGEPAELATNQEGGYALYRKHCLHCHGVSGAGDGPTATFLYPRPRDYRKGLFKFTSTTSLHKPARSDLRRTIKNGLHGTSMPAFEALMTDSEIEQVVDYMTFLAMRGEVELGLIDVAASDGSLSTDTIDETLELVFKRWKDAEHEVENPPVPRPEPTHDSVVRGRNLFLGVNKTGNKVECTTCHGPQGVGNGPSFVDQEFFNEIVFGGSPSEQAQRVDEVVKRLREEAAERVAGAGDAASVEAQKKSAADAAEDKFREAWKTSLDDWGNPFRPANLNRGVYKGGRRPIDIYWRIAKGINGAKMPAHYPTLQADQIWDLVNFVLALPYEPTLLDGPDVPAPAPIAPKPAVAQQ